MKSEPTVYVVDDDRAVLDSIVWLLASAGITAVETFSSAEAFLEGLPADARGCVILDVAMPGLSGLDLLERNGSKRIALPVIVLTAHGDVPSAVRAVKAGARTMLEKPLPPRELVEHVRAALADDDRDNMRRREASDLAARIEILTAREREVLKHLLEGRSSRLIGLALGISPRTVDVHRFRILHKTASDSVTDLVRRVLDLGVPFEQARTPR